MLFTADAVSGAARMTHGCALKAPLPLRPYFHSVPSSPSVVAAGVGGYLFSPSCHGNLDPSLPEHLAAAFPVIVMTTVPLCSVHPVTH